MFLDYLIPIFSITIFFVIPKEKIEIKLLYVIGLSVFGEFIVNKINPSGTFIFTQTISFIVTIIIPFYYFIIDKNIFYCYPNKLLVILLLFNIFYFLFLSAVREINPIYYLTDLRRNLHGILLYIIGINFFNKNSIYIFKKYLYLFFVILCILAVTQFFGNATVFDFFAKWNEYQKGDEIFYTDISRIYSTFGRLINTVFPRYNNYGNYICILAIVLGLMSYKLENNIRKTSIILILGLFLVLISGNRVSLLSYAIGVTTFFFFFNKKYTLIIITFVIIVLVSLNYIIYDLAYFYSASSKKEFSSPLERMMGLFTIFVNPFQSDYTTLSTFGLTILMLPYLFVNPIIGIGKYYLDGYPLIYHGSANITDATFAVYFAEFGLIGTLIIYFVFFIIYKATQKYTADAKILLFPVLITVFIQTITDAGIFNPQSSYLYFIYFALISSSTKMK